MFHGQGSVERGFSVNKELLVTNLIQQSIISQRLVYDTINYLDTELHDFKISSDLLKSCKLGHSRYVQVLDKQKEVQVVDNKSLKRKLIQEEITEIKRKKMLVEEPIKAMDGDVENLCLQTKEKGDLTLLSKANTFQRSSKEKKENVHVINKALLELQDKLKNF